MSDTKINIFDFINQIQNKTTKYEYDKKIAPGYSLSAILAHNEYYLPIVNRMNLLQMYVPDKFVYAYYHDMISGYQKLNFTKKDKKKMKERKEKVKEIQREYNVSKREALLILVHKERL